MASPASWSVPRRPTIAVSTIRYSGSAARVPSAGMPSPMMRRSTDVSTLLIRCRWSSSRSEARRAHLAQRRASGRAGASGREEADVAVRAVEGGGGDVAGLVGADAQQTGQLAGVVHEVLVAGPDRVEDCEHRLGGLDLELAVLLVVVG